MAARPDRPGTTYSTKKGFLLHSGGAKGGGAELHIVGLHLLRKRKSALPVMLTMHGGGIGGEPANPVLIDGEKAVTLSGANTVDEFRTLGEECVEKRWASGRMNPSA